MKKLNFLSIRTQIDNIDLGVEPKRDTRKEILDLERTDKDR